jgi:hypothetical protein
LFGLLGLGVGAFIEAAEEFVAGAGAGGFVDPGGPGVVTIAGKLGADLPVGTERSILKQAGL